jgi:beta-lactamase superfamily II metal-dependent hydrolase
MGFEIDFMPVGEGEKNGDAIALRYGQPGNYTVYVVDGGYSQSGEKLVEHIQTHYDNPGYINYVLCTHADMDHCSGLRTVIENFEIGALYMNRPWVHAAEMLNQGLFKSSRWTVEGLEKTLRDEYRIIAELEEMAKERGIPIRTAFQGQSVGQFHILSPSRQRYLELVAQFDRTPAAAKMEATLDALGLFKSAMDKVVEWVGESWGYETLSEDAETSPENESSIVQLANLDGRLVLLTGDAGVTSLHEAADYAEALGVKLPGVDFMQMPHHGSRRNVSPSVLNRWLGPRLLLPTEKMTVYASVAKECETHPRRKVVNAFIRRGASVHTTKGVGKCHRYQMPLRGGFIASEPLAFFHKVEK